MSTTVRESSVQKSAQIQIEPDIIIPQGSNFSGLCELTSNGGEYILGFESSGFTIDHKRALAKLTADAVGFVEDPDWIKLVTDAGMEKKYALNIAEMGLLLQAFCSTGELDTQTGKPNGSLLVLGITTPFCGHSSDLLHNTGAAVQKAYKRYAELAQISDDFSNIEKSIERGTPAAKSQYTFISEYKKQNNGQSPCDERVFAYFSGWTTPAGYSKLLDIRENILNNGQYFFGSSAEAKILKVQKLNPATGKIHEITSTQKEKAIVLLSHVSGYIAGYEMVREMAPNLANEDFETRIIILQHASEIARYKASDEVLKKYSGITVYENEIRRISLLRPEQYSIVDMETVSDYFRTKSNN